MIANKEYVLVGGTYNEVVVEVGDSERYGAMSRFVSGKETEAVIFCDEDETSKRFN